MTILLNSDCILALLNEHAVEMAQRFQIRQLGLFGSYARNEASLQSDVDILVDFKQPTFDNYMDLKFYLEDLLHRKIDLVMADTLKPRLKPRILREVRYVPRLQAIS